MNIIEAIQAAESGALITNNFLGDNRCLKYIGNGLFCLYNLVEGQPVWLRPVTGFSMAEVLSTGWKVLETNVKF